MVDFDAHAVAFAALGISVVAVSGDAVSDTADLAAGLQLHFVQIVAAVDAIAVAEATGAAVNAKGKPPFFHATGFLLRPDGGILVSVSSSGPIGRFTPSEIIRTVATYQA